MTEQEALRDITQKINEATTEMRAANDRAEKQIAEHQTVSAETRAKLDAANTAITELRDEQKTILARLNRPVHINGTQGELTEEQRHASAVYEKFLRFGIGENSKAQWDQAEIDTLKRVQTVRQRELPVELRSLIGASDATGQFLVPTEFESSIIMLAYQQAEIRPYADVGTTSRDSVVMPALKRPAFAWSRRGVDITAQSLATGAERMPINELTGLMLISNDTLEDADANIYGELSAAFGPGLAEEEDEAFAIGIGDDSPEGVAASTAVQALYKPSGVAAALSDSTHNGMDCLISAYGALKKAYRSTAVWAMNSVTEAAVRSLKTGDGIYLWQPNSQADKPPTLLGRPVINPEGMPAIGAGTFPIVIGSFQRGYRIRDRRGLTVQRLVEKYAEKRQTGFLVTRRLGGQVVVPEAFVPIKIAAS